MYKKDFRLLDIVTLKKSYNLLIGNHKAKFHGAGMEFDDLKQYNIGDDVKHIDWLSSAKQNKIFVKKYIEDRELPVLFIFALGSSIQFGLEETKKIDTVKSIFNILSQSAFHFNNPIGSIFYNEELSHINECKRGQLNILKSINILDNFSRYNSSINSNYKIPFEYIFKKKLKNNMIFFISDETDIISDKYLKAISANNDFVYIHISDSFENSLEGDGMVTLSYNKESFAINLNNNKKLEYIKQRTLELENLKNIIVSAGGSYMGVDNKSNIYKVLYNFFKLRQKLI